MTKKVVDVNYLEDPKLGTFLKSNPRNRAVLTEYLAMESYNSSDPLQSIGQYLPYLALHPKQVLVLKGMRKVVQLSCKRKGMQKRLVDEFQTKEFPRFCEAIKCIKEGDQAYAHWLRVTHQAAKKHLDGAMLKDADAIEDALNAFRELVTLSELKELRKEGIGRSRILKKLPQHVMSLAIVLIGAHEDKPEFPRLFSDAVNTLVFRMALAFYIQTLLRFSTGADATVNPSKHRNDMVDCTYVAYATFFDGLLTSDRKLNEVYLWTCAALELFDGFLNDHQ